MKEAMQATLKISKIRQATLRKNITLKRPTARNVLDIGDIDESMVDVSAITVDVQTKTAIRRTIGMATLGLPMRASETSLQAEMRCKRS